MKSHIDKAEEEIVEKMSFKDYKLSSAEKKKSPSKSKAKDQSERRHQKKNKLTLYLTNEEETLFTEIYLKRLKESKKTDRSTLFSEAIRLLHKKEIKG